LVLHEITFVAIFEHQIEVIRCFLDIKELNNVIIVACAQDSNFVFKQFIEFAFEQLSLDDLDGDILIIRLVVSLEYITKLP